jgi:hypothetical protein
MRRDETIKIANYYANAVGLSSIKNIENALKN